MTFLIILVGQLLAIYIANSSTTGEDGVTIDQEKVNRNNIAWVIYWIIYIVCLVITFFTGKGVNL